MCLLRRDGTKVPLEVRYSHVDETGYRVFEVDWPDWCVMVPGDAISCSYLPLKTEIVVTGTLDEGSRNGGYEW